MASGMSGRLIALGLAALCTGWMNAEPGAPMTLWKGRAPGEKGDVPVENTEAVDHIGLAFHIGELDAHFLRAHAVGRADPVGRFRRGNFDRKAALKIELQVVAVQHD